MKMAYSSSDIPAIKYSKQLVELIRNKQSPPHFIGKQGELAVKIGVLQPPTVGLLNGCYMCLF